MPYVGSAPPGQVVLDGIRKQAMHAMENDAVSSIDPGTLLWFLPEFLPRPHFW